MSSYCTFSGMLVITSITVHSFSPKSFPSIFASVAGLNVCPLPIASNIEPATTRVCVFDVLLYKCLKRVYELLSRKSPGCGLPIGNIVPF